VQRDNLVIGSVNMNSGLVTFSDNSFVSLARAQHPRPGPLRRIDGELS
jgi:hypothetical protein